MPAEAVDLVSRLLQYSPKLRSTALSTTSSWVQTWAWHLVPFLNHCCFTALSIM